MEELTHKYRLLEALATTITHEVRTPLVGIRGYSSVLLQDKIGEINEEQRECVTAIENFAERAMALLDQFLNAHQALLGFLYLNFEEINIEGLLREIKPDNLNLEIPQGTPKIWVDPYHLREAFREFFLEAKLGGDETKASLQINTNDERLNIKIVSEGYRTYFTSEEYPNPMLFYAQTVIEKHGGEYQLVELEGKTEITILLPINREQESI